MEKHRGTVKIRYWYSQVLGPRSRAAGVSLSLAPQDKYEFVDAASWTYESYSHAVERGARDGLLEINCDPDLGIKITLEAVEQDPIDCSEIAFYKAAKCATLSRAEMRKDYNKS